jgi:hypothetical protein
MYLKYTDFSFPVKAFRKHAVKLSEFKIFMVNYIQLLPGDYEKKKDDINHQEKV